MDYLQLHGDETPEYVAELRRRLPDVPVIRAFRCRGADLTTVEQFVWQCTEREAELAGVLLDAYQPGQYGGTGKSLDWQLLATRPESLRPYPLILAGGLRPHNVADAIRLVRPDAVDTASGVELTAGRKDPSLVRDFVQAARAALAESRK